MRAHVRRTRGRLVRLGCTVLIAAVLGACAGSPVPHGSGAATNADNAMMKPDLKILGSGSAFIPLWVADQQGFLTERGLTTNFEQVLQFPSIVESLSANQADAATLTWESVISAASAAPGMKLVISSSVGFPVSFALKPEVAAKYGITATGPFDQLAGLKGSHLKVSAGEIGAALYVWLTAIADDAGLTAGPEPTNDLVLIPATAGPPQVALWNRDEVDAILIPDEFAVSTGLSENVSVPVGRNAPTFEGIGGAGIAVSEDLLSEHPETVQALVDAAYRGLDWVADPANKDAVIQLMVSKMSMPEAGARTFYDRYQAALARGADICMTDSAYAGTLKLANAGRPSPISVPKSDVIDSSFCDSAAAGLR